MLDELLFRRPFLTIIAVWLTALLLVWPVGEFPLNDDWAYAQAVKRFSELGEYCVGDWPAMTLLTQVLWGALFVKVFGFSFLILRLSTIVIALLGLAALNSMLRALGLPGWYRAFAMALLAFNPLFFGLSVTFMTDVPFVSLLLLTSWCYLKALQGGRPLWWALAMLGSAAAVLLRQPGLLLPAAFFGAVLLAGPQPRLILLSGMSMALSFAALEGYVWWQESTGDLSAAFGHAGKLIGLLRSPGIWDRIVFYCGFGILYLGMFLLPLLLLPPWRRNSRTVLLIVLIAMGIALFPILQAWGHGDLGNTLYNLGLGAITLPGQGYHPDIHRQLPDWATTAVSAVAAIGGLLLSGYITLRLWGLARNFPALVRAERRKGEGVMEWRRNFQLGIAGFLVAYGSFLLPNYIFFDRYLLPMVAFFPLLLHPGDHPPGKARAITTSLALVIMAAFSFAGTHDYLAWNRTRWTALDALMARGVFPNEIDGGFEFNGWYETGGPNPHGPYSKSWWFVDEDIYSIAFAPYGNYHIMKRLTYPKWLFPSQGSLYLLMRPDWIAADTLFYDMEPGSQVINGPFTRFPPSELQPLAPGRKPGQHAFQMDADKEFALTHQLYPVQPGDELSFTFWIKPFSRGLMLINSAPDPGQFYHSLPLMQAAQLAGGWQRMESIMRLPPDFPSDTLSFYFWKPGPEIILIDDFQIVWQWADERRLRE